VHSTMTIGCDATRRAVRRCQPRLAILWATPRIGYAGLGANDRVRRRWWRDVMVLVQVPLTTTFGTCRLIPALLLYALTSCKPNSCLMRHEIIILTSTLQPYNRRQVCTRLPLLSSCVCPSAFPSVRLFITRRYCLKTAKHMIMRTRPHNCPGTLVFWHPRSWRNSNGVTPSGVSNALGMGRLKSATLDK